MHASISDHERVEEVSDTISIPIINTSLPAILSEETEYVYTVLEQTQLQQPPTVIQLEETTEQDQQSCFILETVPSNGFQAVTDRTGPKSRSAAWTSAQQSMVGAKPRNLNLELVQIYNNMTIEREGRAAADVDAGSLYPGNYREHSLPANLGVNQHSNMSQDCLVSYGCDTKPDEPIPIYSHPDMNKKREAHQKKKEQKEQEERMVALQKVSSSSCSPLPQITERKLKNKLSIATDSGTVVDGQQQADTDLKFGKQFDRPKNNPDDKVLMDNDECLYDAPTSLDLVPKKNNIIAGYYLQTTQLGSQKCSGYEEEEEKEKRE